VFIAAYLYVDFVYIPNLTSVRSHHTHTHVNRSQMYWFIVSFPCIHQYGHITVTYIRTDTQYRFLLLCKFNRVVYSIFIWLTSGSLLLAARHCKVILLLLLLT